MDIIGQLVATEGGQKLTNFYLSVFSVLLVDLQVIFCLIKLKFSEWLHKGHISYLRISVKQMV
jgi:hypothetical protein